MSTSTLVDSARPGRLLAAGGALFGVYALSHPRGAEHPGNLEEALGGMMAAAGQWAASHALGLVSLALIVTALWLQLRGGSLDGSPRLRAATRLLFGGAVIGFVEHVPHLLAVSERAAVLTGGATPITDLHLLLQALFTPVYGAGLLAVALTGFGRVAHPIACVLGMLGALALIPVAPLLLLTGDASFGFLFMPASLTWVFLIAAGVRLARGGITSTRAVVPAG